MYFKAVQDKKEGVLSLSGELTLLQVAQLKVELTQVLDTSERVTIDIQALEGIDLACLQVLCAAHRSAVSRGSRLSLSPQSCDAITTTAGNAGLMRCHACTGVGENTCLWNGGER
jgi:anti-anti-sigma regulatory factor